MKTKIAAVYVRVSTTDQHTELQENELREYCEHRGWQYRVYRDAGQSGAKDNRPALMEMITDIRKRKVDVIVIWALDRLARSLKHLLSIAEECKTLGVDIICLKQNIDTTLPAGRLTFQLLGAVAEFERELLRERVKAGMAQAKRSGKKIGRPALRRFGATELERIRALRRDGDERPEAGKRVCNNTVDDFQTHGSRRNGRGRAVIIPTCMSHSEKLKPV